MSEPAVDVDEWCIRTAIQQAAQSMHEKGIPIGAALFQDAHLGSREKVKLLGMGRNQRIQKGSATLHGEISALENAGRLSADVYKKCTMVSVDLISIRCRDMLNKLFTMLVGCSTRL